MSDALSPLLDAYCDGTIDADGAEALAAAIRGGGAEAEWVMDHLALVGLMQQAHDDASPDAMAAGFLERLRAERTGSALVSAVRERSASTRGRAGVSERRSATGARSRPWLIGGGTVAVLALLAVMMWSQSAGPARGAEIVRIQSVDGMVSVLRADGTRVAAPGGGLAPGESLVTHAGSATVAFADGTTIALAADSELGAVAATGNGRSLALMRGAMRADVAKQRAGQTLAIATSHGTVQVVGTRFSLAVVADTTRVEVEEGSVRFSASRSAGDALTVPAGQFAVAVADDGTGARIYRGDAAHVRDVTALGATPDDVEDDAYAIQEAIDAASAGDVVRFPAGTYRLRHTLRMRAGVALRGESRTRTVLRYDGADAGMMIACSSVSDVEISELTIDGAGAASGPAIYAYDGARLHLHHLAIHDFVGDHALAIHFIGDQGVTEYARGVTDSVIADNLIARMGVQATWGGGVRLSWGSSRVRIERNRIDATGRGGIFANDGCADLVIVGNTVTGSGLAAERFGIEIWGTCPRAVIADNRVDHRISVAGCDRVALRANTVRVAVDDRSDPAVAGLSLFGDDLVITGNRIERGQRTGIMINATSPCRHAYLSGNRVTAMSGCGMLIRAAQPGLVQGLYLVDNVISDTRLADGASGAGVVIDAGDGQVSDIALERNQVTGNAGPGLITRDAVVDVTTRDDRVAGNGAAASTSVTVGTDTAPIHIAAPATARVGELVRFVSDAPAGAHVLWDFADGIPETGAEATHVFLRSGSYQVTQIAWGADGRPARSGQTIAVTPR